MLITCEADRSIPVVPPEVIGDARHCLDLYKLAGVTEYGDSDESARRASEMFLNGLPGANEICSVAASDEDRCLEYMSDIGAGGGQHGDEVVDRLTRLRLKVAWRDDLAGVVPRAGTSGEDEIVCRSEVVVRDSGIETHDPTS